MTKTTRLLVVTMSAFAVIGAGCTFLVSFDDVVDGGGAASGSLKDSGVNPPDSGGSSSSSSGSSGSSGDSSTPPQTPDVCDLAFQLDSIKGCDAFQNNGQICADVKGFTFAVGYDASADVVTCSKVGAAHASCIKHCHGPGKCAHNPEGFPDQCDRCEGKPDGKYCGGEMAGWPSETFNLLISCTNDRISSTTISCPTTCNPNGGGGKAACK